MNKMSNVICSAPFIIQLIVFGHIELIAPFLPIIKLESISAMMLNVIHITITDTRGMAEDSWNNVPLFYFYLQNASTDHARSSDFSYSLGPLLIPKSTVYFEQVQLNFQVLMVKCTSLSDTVRHWRHVFCEFVVNLQMLILDNFSHVTTSNAFWESNMAAITFVLCSMYEFTA